MPEPRKTAILQVASVVRLGGARGRERAKQRRRTMERMERKGSMMRVVL